MQKTDGGGVGDVVGIRAFEQKLGQAILLGVIAQRLVRLEPAHDASARERRVLKAPSSSGNSRSRILTSPDSIVLLTT